MQTDGRSTRSFFADAAIRGAFGDCDLFEAPDEMGVESPVEMGERVAQPRWRMNGLDIVIFAASPPREVRKLADEIVDPFVHFRQGFGKRIRIVVVETTG